MYQQFLAIQAELERLPGNQGAMFTNFIPPFGEWSKVQYPKTPAGLGPSELPTITDHQISPGFFRCLQLPILRGRTISSSDVANELSVVVISEGLARDTKAFQGDPIGQTIQYSDGSGFKRYEVIGICVNGAPDWEQDVDRSGYRPELLSAPQLQVNHTYFYVRFPAAMAGSQIETVRSSIQKSCPSAIIGSVGRFQPFGSDLFGSWLIVIVLQTLVALVALTLACIGIFAVFSSDVSSKRRDFGILAALGATPRRILIGILRSAGGRAIVGTVLGVLIAALCAPLYRYELYQVGYYDPATYISIPLLIIVVALLSAWLPAREATRVDPLEAIRAE
jgi:hypothetical protein